jgi:pimeloyl-ACP methyl ester carboxylesterase
MIKRRYVYHLCGYGPIGTGWYRVFKRELPTFAKTWNLSSQVSEPSVHAATSSPHWQVTTVAPNWHVETGYEMLVWDDIILSDFARSTAGRLVGSSQAFLDFIRTRSAGRYFKANWQYGLFFLFPFVMLLSFLIVAAVIAYHVASLLSSYAWQVALFVPLSAAIFLILLRWPGQRWSVLHGLDDWIFSWEYVYGRRPDVESRVDRFAAALVARCRDTAMDEVVVLGHSMGSTLAVEVVARALEIDPNLGRRGPAVCLLTVGSTIPKFALHPAGERFRRHAAQIVAEPSIAWAEYQARSDLVSFYKFDPVKLTRFYGDPMRGKPLMRRVWIQDMLEPQTYRRIRLKFRIMRMHHQFVMANEKRSTYDYFMFVCGPIPFSHCTLSPTGPVELIGSDGALIGQLASPVSENCASSASSGRASDMTPSGVPS